MNLISSPSIRSSRPNYFPVSGLLLVLVLLVCQVILPSLSAADETVSRQAFVQELTLAKNSPNPFNANTTINYSLLQAAWVKVDVFDLKGRHVVTLLDEFQPEGDNFAIWKTEVTPSGTYFFCLSVDEFQVFGKMSLVK